MQVNREDGIRLKEQIVEQLRAIDEAKLTLRDASDELGGTESSVGTELALAAGLCRLASDIVVAQVKELERAYRAATQEPTGLQGSIGGSNASVI
jgi:hypothetical protein